MALSSSEEEESLLISVSIFCLYKEQKHGFKRLAVVTRLTFGVSNLLHAHFHCKVLAHFSSLILSEIAPNVRFREAKFQNFPGSMPPDPPSVLAPPVLDPPLAGSTLNYFHRSCSDPKNGRECQIEID